MSVHYFSYPRVTFFFWFFCLMAWRKKHKSNKETKHYAFCVKKNKSKIQKQKFMLFVFKQITKSKTKKNQNLCFLFLKKKTKVYIFCFFVYSR